MTRQANFQPVPIPTQGATDKKGLYLARKFLLDLEIQGFQTVRRMLKKIARQ